MKSQKSYADDVRQIIERIKHRDDEWEVKLRVYDTMSTLEIRNKSDRGTWFTRQMVAVANYAEAFALTFWLNNDKDYDSGEQWLVGKISLPQTEKQRNASEAERKKRKEARNAEGK